VFESKLIQGFYSLGFESPTLIQKRAIIPILRGRDVLAQAQSGTGKSSLIGIASCSIPTSSLDTLQILILSPTRELAVQTEKVTSSLAHYVGLRVARCIGGQRFNDFLNGFSSGMQVLSATPGRLIALLLCKQISTSSLKTLFLDEADEMLSRGFKKQVYDIYRCLPNSLQLVLISATLPSAVIEISCKFLFDPICIIIKRDELTLNNVEQFYINVELEYYKLDTFLDLYDELVITQAVVFCNTKRKVEWLSSNLRRRNFTIASLHADMDQETRFSINNSFKRGDMRILVTTDLWGRGLDVQEISLVVNFDFPRSREQYLHRIGRSGRFGRRGVAISFVRKDEHCLILEIQQFFSTQIDEMPCILCDMK
jgi:ATP-dependent RNA helicase